MKVERETRELVPVVKFQVTIDFDNADQTQIIKFGGPKREEACVDLYTFEKQLWKLRLLNRMEDKEATVFVTDVQRKMLCT